MSSLQCTYRAYGLHISSEHPIFEFAHQSFRHTPPIDINIQWRNTNFHPEYGDKDWSFSTGPQEALLCFRGVGCFHVVAPHLIVVAPEKGADNRMVQRYLSGIVFAVMLHLRGMVVFHGAGVAINEHEALVIAGESGAGKSTLAALLHLYGYSCTNDDVAAIHVQLTKINLIPGIPLAKIDEEFMRRYHIQKEQTCPVHPSEQEVYLHLAPHFPENPLKLRAIIFLEHGSCTTLQRLSARQAMIETVRYTLPARLLLQPGSRQHFYNETQLAESVPAYQLTRAADQDSREQLAAIIMREFF